MNGRYLLLHTVFSSRYASAKIQIHWCASGKEAHRLQISTQFHNHPLNVHQIEHGIFVDDLDNIPKLKI